MRQHIFCFTVFIIIFGGMSFGTVDAATCMENFNSDPGWLSFNLSVNNNDFGFRDSEFAGGNPGEVGGFFSRSDEVAWYGDITIGDFTGDEILSVSGLMNIYNVDPDYNANIHVGHFNSFGPPRINGIGFQILESSPPAHSLAVSFIRLETLKVNFLLLMASTSHGPGAIFMIHTMAAMAV